MQTTDVLPLKLTLTVRNTITVLPRCLQVLSRRGFMLVSLRTDDSGDTALLRILVVGPKHWHAAVPELLSKLVDVQSVTVEHSHA